MTGLILANSISAMADDKQCMTVGGTGFAQALNETNLVASVTGSFAGGARAVVTSQQKTPTGLILGMEHSFFNDRGGLLNTKDTATLTDVSGRENIYMLEISYDIQTASGAFAGFEGGFNSAGLIDFNIGKVVLQYSGEICK